MQIEKIHISKLKAAEYNPRKELKPGDAEYEKLKRSLTDFGFVEPLVWNKTTGNVVGGHQRLSVLKDLGETEIDCVVVELDELKEKALNIALNKVQGSWDNDKLSALLSDLDAKSFDVSMTGFDASEVDELLGGYYSTEAVEDDFDTEKAVEDSKENGTDTKPGDVWELGDHRLMCGNSGDTSDIEKLMNGNKAQLAVTSPLLSMSKEYEKNGIEPWLKDTEAVIKNLAKYSSLVCWNLGDMYSTGTQFIEPTSVHSVKLFGDYGLRPIWIRIWKKTRQIAAASAYHLVTNKPIPQYEYVSAFGKGGEEEYTDQEYSWLSAFAGHSYKFVKRLTKDERKKWGYSGIWEMPPVKTHQDTLGGVPVELPWRCIKMHSDAGGIVLDPYGNSGTTLIAAEQTNRKCFAMERDPYMVDAIVKRWENFTGQRAVKLC